MQSIKIIKQHGNPSGLPVLTAYVDPDAPGEAGSSKKYLQTVVFSSGIVLNFVTDKSTALTQAEITTIIKNAGYDSASNALKIATAGQYTSASTGVINLNLYLGIFASGTNLYADKNTKTLSIVDGVLTLSTPTATNSPQIVDKIFIQEI